MQDKKLPQRASSRFDNINNTNYNNKGADMNKQLDEKIINYLKANRENFISDLRGLVNIDSTFADDKSNKPYGQGNADALDYMMNKCTDAGLECRNIDYYCMDATIGEGKEVAASLSHLDIVPVGEGWLHTPLGGEVIGSLMYGRGTLDDKGPLMASLYAVSALIAADAKLNRKVRLIFGCDEERGMSDLHYYLKKCKAPDYAFSPDASFPAVYAEKTVINGKYKTNIKDETIVKKIFGGTRSNVVPESATAIVSRIGTFSNDPDIVIKDKDGMYEITAAGMSAHASTPEKGRSAFMILFRYLMRTLPSGDAYKKITEQLYNSFNFTNGTRLKIDCSDEPTGPLTINLGVIKGDKNSFECIIDIRHPITLSHDLTYKKLLYALSGFKFAEYKCSVGLFLPKNHTLIKILQNVYAEVTGDKTEPKSMGGGTYARTLPCAAAFGPVFPDSKSRGAHMADECADIDELLSAARIYAHCLYELSNMH